MFRTTKCSSSRRSVHAVLWYSLMHAYKESVWCQDMFEYQTHPTGLNLISTCLILLDIMQVSTAMLRSTTCHTFLLYGLSICPYTIHVFLASLQCIVFVCPFICTNVSRGSHFCRFCFLYVRKERNKFKTAVSWDVMPSNMADWYPYVKSTCWIHLQEPSLLSTDKTIHNVNVLEEWNTHSHCRKHHNPYEICVNFMDWNLKFSAQLPKYYHLRN
jgi:hypothetical protein